MRHNQVRESLPCYLNGTLRQRERAAVEEHLAGCSSCRRELNEWQAISEAVTAQPAPRVPATTLATLLNRLDAPTLPSSHTPARPAWQSAFAFAAILLMLAAVLLMPSAQLRLEWVAGAPEEVAAFTIYRSETADRPQEAILTAPSQALIDNGGYAYTDSSVRPGRSYNYWLEAQSAAGVTTPAGPIPAVPDNTRALTKAAAAACLVAGLLAGLWLMRDEIGRGVRKLPLQSI